MKLCAIFNAFDGLELLPASIKTIEEHVDLIIILYQQISNIGEKHDVRFELESVGLDQKALLVKFDPWLDMGPGMNERAKRNLGLDFARANKCTHFIGMDVDELYEDFGAAKKLYIDSGHAGSVCRMQTYFKKPTFQFDRPEDYYVPFIHQLNEDTKSGSSSYKFYVDPTRAITESDVVELPIFMHHFSWCRLDIMRKARNSTAQGIIKNSLIMEDYNSPDLGEGYLLRNWGRKIKIVPDIFGLSEIFE
jgi:hypothetical protein